METELVRFKSLGEQVLVEMDDQEPRVARASQVEDMVV
jgi:hypothetical protein